MGDQRAVAADARADAVEWYTRLNHTALTAAEMERFRAWRRHPTNEAAFRAVEAESAPTVVGELTVATGAPPVRIPQPLGIFAGELMERASEYLEAAKRLDTDEARPLVHPRYFLISHAVELALKAYLVARGTTKRKLRGKKMGHDLPALQAAAIAADLPLVPELDDLIWHLAGISEDHALRYPAGYIVRVPFAHQCFDVIAQLLAEIKPAIELAYLKSRMSHLAHYHGTPVVWSD